jgi:glutaredoxin 3
MDSKIIIYGAEWCAFCHAAKRYLDDLGVKYDYKDVELSNDDAKAAIQKSGQMGIPVIDMDGEIVVGFDRPRIDHALKAKRLQ